MSSPIDSGIDELLVEVHEGIARVTFNNPAKRNALSVAVRDALPHVLGRLGDDPDVRVVVVTGAGTRAFASGADLSEPDGHPGSAEARMAFHRQWVASYRVWSSLDKPVIAMIRGFCLGAGLLTALRADLRIASDDSQFGIPAARVGLGYSYEGVRPLLDVVGPAWTSEILFTARRLSAAEALRIGLVNRVVAPGDLEDEVMGLARSIRANAPLTIAAGKAAIREARREPHERDLDRVTDLIRACFESDDYHEGRRAFAEKRAPRFTGR